MNHTFCKIYKLFSSQGPKHVPTMSKISGIAKFPICEYLSHTDTADENKTTSSYSIFKHN